MNRIIIVLLLLATSPAWGADNKSSWVLMTHKNLQVGSAMGPFTAADCQERAQDLESHLNDNAKLTGMHEWRHAKCVTSATEPFPER